MNTKNSETTLIDLPQNIKIEKPVFQKMMFLTNALEEGWSIRKSNDSYIFTKKHENKREIFQEDYLEKFVLTNSTNVLGISSQL
ncbi:hypothetical protein OAS95_04645 [Pelagibacteraceae bacterium]|jgi:hypothetical protein|nr:hypothetical protein [Pelagibacteraceae bacterium]